MDRTTTEEISRSDHNDEPLGQSAPSDEPGEKQANTTSPLDWRVWVIFSGLAVSALLSALEGSIISTALPTITAELGSGGNYVWVINLYFLTR